MFTADAIIDTVQTGKKTFVNTFVTNDTVKESLVKFIDAQSEYTKKAAKVGMDTFTTFSSEAMKQMQEATKYDYTKAYTDLAEKFKTKK
jgi:ATP phosphoribosyltransferase